MIALDIFQTNVTSNEVAKVVHDGQMTVSKCNGWIHGHLYYCYCCYYYSTRALQANTLPPFRSGTCAQLNTHHTHIICTLSLWCFLLFCFWKLIIHDECSGSSNGSSNQILMSCQSHRVTSGQSNLGHISKYTFLISFHR